MWNYLVRFFTYIKEECLDLKRRETAPYPFHRSLKEFLPQSYSPLFAIQFCRDIATDLGISFIQAQILLFLVSEETAISISEIHTESDHLSLNHIQRLLRELSEKDYVYKITNMDGTVSYGLTLELRDNIGSYYKD